MNIIIPLLLIAFILLIAVVFPKFADTEGKALRQRAKQLSDEYFYAHSEQNLEKRRLLFERLTLATDRVLSHTLSHFGIKEQSVKQQLRQAMQQKTITYDQFQLVKRFHHFRNEVVHEGLQVSGENEKFIYEAITVIRSILGD